MGAIELVPKPIWPRSISLNIPKRMRPWWPFPDHHQIEIGSERQFVDAFREKIRDAYSIRSSDLSHLFHEGKFIGLLTDRTFATCTVERLCTGK